MGRICSESDSGCGSSGGRNSQRVHFYSSHGPRQRSDRSTGERMSLNLVLSSYCELTDSRFPLCHNPQAFTVVAVFNSMTFALKVTPMAVRALSEAAIAAKRFQVTFHTNVYDAFKEVIHQKWKIGSSFILLLSTMSPVNTKTL